MRIHQPPLQTRVTIHNRSRLPRQPITGFFIDVVGKLHILHKNQRGDLIDWKQPRVYGDVSRAKVRIAKLTKFLFIESLPQWSYDDGDTIGSNKKLQSHGQISLTSIQRNRLQLLLSLRVKREFKIVITTLLHQRITTFYWLNLSLIDNLPCACNNNIAAAVNCLVTEPISNDCLSVSLVLLSISLSPTLAW